MFRTLLAALALIAVAASANANGGFETGATLLELCKRPGIDICLGYIAGISDAMDSGHDAISGWRACVPNETPNSKIGDVVVQALQRHPETRHYLASGLVAYALSQAFPCPD